MPDDDHSGDDETLGGDDNPGENDNPGGEDDSNEGDDDQNLIYVNGSYSAQALCVPDEDEDFAAYNLSLRITVENDRIIGVTAITGDGDKNNDSYIKRAANGTSKLPGVVNQILETGMPDNIDTVSMATCSSKAIIEACAQALEYARR